MRPALLAFVALLLVAAPAQAEPPRHAFQLDYVRGNGALVCPDEAALRKELVGIMHYDAVQAGAPNRITVVIERRKDVLTGIAIMRDDAGHVLWQTDEIPTTSACRILVGALALAIDAYLGHPMTPEPPAAPPEAPKASITVAGPAPEEPARPPPAPPRPPEVHTVPTLAPVTRSVSGYIGVDVLGNVGITPKLSVGPSFVAGLRLRDPEISFELGGRAAWTITATDQPSYNDDLLPVRSTLLALTAGVCGTFDHFIFLCGHAGAGTLFFNSPDHSSAFSARAGFSLVGGRIGIERSITRAFKLRAFGEFDGVPGSSDMSVSRIQAWTKPVISGAVGVGVLWGRW